MQTEVNRLSAIVASLDGVHTGPIQRAAYDAEFERLCPALSMYIPIDIFLNHCTSVLGLTFKGSSTVGSTLARCAYDACLYVTQTPGICSKVYLIFRAAFTAFESTRDSLTILLWIRLRAIFLMYANEQLQLPYLSARNLVEDLVLTSEHLQPIFSTLQLHPGMQPWSWEYFSNREMLGARFTACKLPRSGGSNLKPRAMTADAKCVSFAAECGLYAEFPLKLHQTSWKGSLTNERHAGYTIAATILQNAERMYPPESPWLDRIDWESSIIDDGFRNFTPGCPLSFLTSLRSIDDFMEAFDALSSEALRIISAQPIVSRLQVPCKVFGDIQGGFRELLLLFHQTGFPSDHGGDIEMCSYVFNGNFVDVGLHQIEVVCLLLALKVLFPGRVWLNRGNHEFRDQNYGELGFKTCCQKLFLEGDDGLKIFEMAHSVFDWLPLAAVIAESIFVCHGGISHEHGQWHLEELNSLQRHRPITSWAHKNYPNILLQLVWSNPDDAPVDSNRSIYNHLWKKERKVGEKRPITFTQGETDAFMVRNMIHLIIRSHQVPAQGACFHHQGKILTVFSAKNHNGICGNRGAVVLVCSNEYGEIFCRIKATRGPAAESH